MRETATDPLADIQPLFICLGVPKAATTWIHRQLEAHPDIGTTTTKEINYWSSNYANGPAWYRRQFPNDREYQLYGEVSVGYLRETPITRLAENVPSASFMVSLRNPYERSWSSYWQSVRTGVFRGGLEEAIEALPKIIDDSLYSPGLKAFFQRFSRSQLHVALYEDLAIDPRAFIRDIYEFAGVQPNFEPPDLHQAVNIGRRHSLTDEALARLQTLVKNVGLKRSHLISWGLWSAIERTYARLASNRPIPPMSERDWDILEAYIHPELTQLEELLDRDLSAWKRPP